MAMNQPTNLLQNSKIEPKKKCQHLSFIKWDAKSNEKYF